MDQENKAREKKSAQGKKFCLSLGGRGTYLAHIYELADVRVCLYSVTHTLLLHYCSLPLSRPTFFLSILPHSARAVIPWMAACVSFSLPRPRLHDFRKLEAKGEGRSGKKGCHHRRCRRGASGQYRIRGRERGGG